MYYIYYFQYMYVLYTITFSIFVRHNLQVVYISFHFISIYVGTLSNHIFIFIGWNQVMNISLHVNTHTYFFQSYFLSSYAEICRSWIFHFITIIFSMYAGICRLWIFHFISILCPSSVFISIFVHINLLLVNISPHFMQDSFIY